MIIKEERIGGQRLILGDCLEVMKELGAFDAVVTDPPYGVDGGSGTIGKASLKTKYTNAFPDTPDYVANVCAKAVSYALKMSQRGIVTPGVSNCFKYPEPDDMGVIYMPAAVGMSKWGRCTSQPTLFYGRDPRVGLTIQPKHIIATKAAEKCGHPCPKPLYIAEWMVGRASLIKETILDPFMGSGTTLVACQRMGRNGTGIELDESYFRIACQRVDEATRQGDMFVPTVKLKPIENEDMFS
jgi:site-specific DNA-methyltransferase (adenine-specific)